MKLSEYTAYDGVGLAELVARKEITSAELAVSARHAIELVNPTLNAVIEDWPAAEEETGSSALAGVPFLVKDLGVQIAGKRSELGSRLAAGLVAETDSFLMRRFRAAGLVTIGRTTTPEMAFSTTTESVQQGATANPWDPALTAGGSSGGAAAAVASGIVPIAHATDAAGSIRVPAAHTGLVGFKPTRGRSSNGPALDEVFAGFGVQLGVTRSVRDSAALLDAIGVVEPGEPYVTPPPERGFLSEVEREPGQLKIGVMVHPWNGARSAEPIVRATLETARDLERLGHHVEAASPALGASWDALVNASAQIWTSCLVTTIDAVAAATGRPIDATTLEPATLACYRYGREARAVEFVRALDVRNRVTRALGAWFASYDVLLTPVMPDPPLPLGVYARGSEATDGLGWTERMFRHAPFTPPFNVAGLPAMAMPLAWEPETGLPIGLHFGAGFARDALLFRLAGQLERAKPWRARRPRIWAGAQDVCTSATNPRTVART